MTDPRIDRAREIARQVRLRAEAFARRRGYCPDTLVTMCSTVSFGLEVALRHAGLPARTVMGSFFDGSCAHGHFWVEIRRTIVDLTATQFYDALPRVLIAHYHEPPFGDRYRLLACDGEDVRFAVQLHDRKDVAAFLASTKRWLARGGANVAVGATP